ncbi:MAG: transporter [Phycisphaerales bacterium]|nr:transporter [Phycisphaerales bacterium]MDB5358245.1 transporter [Phycisphaerales bacterium]
MIASHLLNLLAVQSLSAPHPGDDIAISLARLSLAITLGLALGAVRIRGIRLGVAGVLFSTLLFGQFGLTVDKSVLHFLRDFSLILFMYAIGLQVGPGFLASLRAEGLRLNLLAIAVLVLGAVMTAAVVRVFSLSHSAAPGLYAGAFTTTPGLAAGQESLRHVLSDTADAGTSAVANAGLAYTVAYPFGIVGPIFVVALLRRIFRVNIREEALSLAALEQTRHSPISVVDFEVTEEAYAGKPLKDHPLLRHNGIVLSRMLRDQVLAVPTAETEIRVGDVYRAVGLQPRVDELVAAMGRPSTANLAQITGDVQRMDLIVTRTKVLRRPLRELDLIRRTGVTIARVTRSGVNLVPHASFRLSFADRVTVVGPAAGLKIVEQELGNCPDTLDRSQLMPIFLGVVLGVFVGFIPLKIPGLGTTLKIGLAGGPMLAAIALSQLGNIGSIVWYMPSAANQLFRDFGLAVFLACVGLESGDHFLEQISQGGLIFAAWGAAVTILPVLLVGIAARVFFKMNFLTLTGWVSGAMTSSPALLFANELTNSDAPSVAYAAVAPLATLTPIICAQFLAMR